MNLFIKIVKSLIGITYMVITVTFAVIFFMNVEGWGDRFFKLTKLEITNNYISPEVNTKSYNDSYITRISKPAHFGLLTGSKKYIQIDWLSNENLPQYIVETIDYNNDGLKDLIINLDAVKNITKIIKFNPNVINLFDTRSLTYGFLKGTNNGEKTVLSFHNYKEPVFLEYTREELDSIDLIKNIISAKYSNNFDNFLNEAKKCKNDIRMICEMKSKHGELNEVEIIFKEELEEEGDDDMIYKMKFKVIDEKKDEKLVIHIEDYEDLEFESVYPITSFQYCLSVRAIIKE